MAPLHVRQILASLHQRGIAARLIHLEDGGSRASSAARALAVSPDCIVKSLLFLADGEPVLVLIPGDRRADAAKMKASLGAKRVMIADPERVLRESGFRPGAVPPLGHTRQLPTWLDKHLLGRQTVYSSAGASDWIVAFSPGDLASAIGCEVASLSKDPRDSRVAHGADCPHES